MAQTRSVRVNSMRFAPTPPEPPTASAGLSLGGDQPSQPEPADSAEAADPFPRYFQPLKGFVFFLAVLSCLYQFVALISSPDLTTLCNILGPVALFMACSFVAYRMLIVNPLVIWTPVPWFLAACALYFGFGPLVYIFGDDATLTDLDAAWFTDENTLLRTNVLNAVGILVIALGFLAGMNVKRFLPRQLAGVSRGSAVSAKVAVLIFLSVGIPVKYLLVLPYQFDLLNFVLPGAAGGLVTLVPLGLMMLGYLSVRCGQPWTTAFLALLAFEMSVDFLRFSKSDLLMGIILAGLGRYLGNQRLRDLTGLALILLPVYFWLCPMVLLCRSEISRRTGNANSASLPERVDVFLTVLEGGSVRDSDVAYFERAWWQRCCYANMQAYCMQAYDSNSPGDTLSSFLFALVPRFLWPDKPDLTLVGEDFTELIFGHRDSFTGIGVFGEAYWNGGWGMVVITCIVIGLIFVGLSRLALGVMHNKNWLFLPCVFIGMRMGFRVDGWILIDCVGSALISVGYYMILSFLSKFLASKEVILHDG